MIENTQQPAGYQSTVGEGKVVQRDPPEVDPGRRDLVKSWCEDIEKAKREWGKEYERMRRDAKFARGKQWTGEIEDDDRYVANITLRHINQRVSSIYAKNPRVRAQRRPKMYLTVWDGSQETLIAAQQTMQQAQTVQTNPAVAAEAMMEGAMPAQPAMPPQQAQAILAEAEQAAAQKRMYSRMGKTLELVAQYSMDEQQPSFKRQAKQLVRRVLTCKVGYLKLGYQRLMEISADIDAKIKDATDRLAHLEMLSADLADKEIQPDGKEAEELKLNIAALQKEREIVVREGLVFGFPKSWSIIIDRNCTQLDGFVGARWIAEEFILSVKQVQKIYKVDVGQSYNAYTEDGTKGDKRHNDKKFCAVYEVYDMEGQVCFTICSGYPDFLKPPAAPDVALEQFHPYYSLTFNDVEDPEGIYPPSDVELLVHPQREYNRSREGLRTHRQANRPATVAADGVFDNDSMEKFATHADHEIIRTNLSKNDDIKKLLMAKPVVPITKELYDVEHCFIDTQRVAGDQPANLGGTSGSTATESTIAENSRVTTIQSNIDDLDDFFTAVMRGAGQILLAEMGKQQVLKIAGPGAVWPDMPPSRKAVAEELYLDIKAGSSGRPNRAARIQAIEKTAPYLLQVPGVKPGKLAEFLLTELDENIELEEFFEEGLPSITAMNAMAKPNMAPAAGNEAQAAQGASNAPQPAQSRGQTQNLRPVGPPAGNQQAA